MRYRVLPYKVGSKSARALADELEGKLLKLEGSVFKPKEGDVLINWGNGTPSDTLVSGGLLNADTGIVTDKLAFFRTMKEKSITCLPRFWEDWNDIPTEDYPVVCRTVLSGHSGAGIVLARDQSEAVMAPLYVKYEKKKEEYRVHIGTKGIIVVQRKARKLDVPDEEVDWQIRNHSNGFVYVRGEVSPPDEVIRAATECFEATGLDFGAVDVLYNEHNQRAFVLEINTAPGLEGQTVMDYANYFRSLNDEV